MMSSESIPIGSLLIRMSHTIGECRKCAATNSTFEDTDSHVNLRTQYTGPAVDKKTGMPVHIWQSFTRLYHLSPFVDLKSEELGAGVESKAFLD